MRRKKPGRCRARVVGKRVPTMLRSCRNLRLYIICSHPLCQAFGAEGATCRRDCGQGDRRKTAKGLLNESRSASPVRKK